MILLLIETDISMIRLIRKRLSTFSIELIVLSQLNEYCGRTDFDMLVVNYNSLRTFGTTIINNIMRQIESVQIFVINTEVHLPRINKLSLIEEILEKILSINHQIQHIKNESKIKLSEKIVYHIFEKKIFLENEHIPLMHIEKMLIQLFIENHDSHITLNDIKNNLFSNSDISLSELKICIYSLSSKLRSGLIVHKRNKGFRLKKII